MPSFSDMPLSRAMNFVWYMLTRNADDQARAKLRAKLWMPPKGVAPTKDSPWSPANETGAFGALRAQLGVKNG